ncbi:MAG: hypothetical protein AB1416_04265 [Actinomycetota bacterium]
MRRPGVHEVRTLAGESVRLAMVRGLLRPAADRLSLRAALRLADLAGTLSAATPHGRGVRRELDRGFGPGEGGRIARAHFALPYRDFVALRRLVTGRDHAEAWRMTEDVPDATVALRESGAPFIVATGHFARLPFYYLYAPPAIPERVHVSAMVAPLPPPGRHPETRRIHLQFGQSLTVLKATRANIDLVVIRECGSVAGLLGNLRQEWQAAVIAADAPAWDGPLTRPFAGRRSRRFALGCAHLARLAQCPVVVCAPSWDGDGRVLLEWGEPIPPPARRDRLADTDVTNAILDQLETAVGRRPDQYLLPIGGDRRWDQAAGRWRDAEPATESERAAPGHAAPAA